MKGYRLTVAAELDMENILDQGIDQYGVDAALTYFDDLECRFAEVAANPLRYPAVDYIAVGYRRTICGIHSVYYRIGDNEVIIVRILNKQDPWVQLL